MMPAATHFDPVLGIDIHIVQPPGPVPPVPVPHPYVGIVFDPFDYIPVIGSTVLINGVHRAIAGTAGKAIPSHIPIGGVFVKPPGNEDENFMGSATVEIDGDAAAYMALPCLSCQCIGTIPPPRINPKKKTKVKSLVLPTSVVLPVPKGPPVLIGGPPTISLTNLAMGAAMGAAMKGLGRGLRRLAKTGIAKRAGAALKKARQGVFRNMSPGFIKCKILRAEPVDVVTGEVVVDQQDFELPGRIPIQWTRHYQSGSERPGTCGMGWETPADARLVVGPERDVIFHDGKGVGAYFERLPDYRPVMELVNGATLHLMEDHFAVRLKGGLSYYFPARGPRRRSNEIMVSAIIDLCHNSLHFIRDEHGLKEVVESAGRRFEVKSRDGLIRELWLNHPDFPERRLLCRYDYDGEGNLVTVYDALDAPYGFAYQNHRLISHTDRNGVTFYYEYDHYEPDGRVLHTWGDGGLYDYRFVYDPENRWTEVTNSLGHSSTIEYDERLLITRETDPLGRTTNFTYDEAGRTTEVVDPAGRATSYRYDDQGNLLELGRPDGTKIVTTYGGEGNPTEQIDANGHPWRMQWDELGLMSRRTSPRGGVWTYEHSGGGSLIAVTDPRDARTRFEHDRCGNVTAIEDALGNLQRFALDPLGNVSRYTDGEGYETRYSHDKKGRLLEIRYPSGSKSRYAYDRENNLISFTDQNGHTTHYRYFGLGELAVRYQADGTTVQYEYDTEERLTAVVNERGQRFELIRDPLSRVIEEIDYWGNPKRYRYDAAGNVAATTDALNRTIRFTYDDLARLLRRQFDDDTEETFAYDPNGNLIVAENATIRVERDFDEDGNMVEERQGEFVVKSKYDPVGNRTARRSGHGNVIEMDHDPSGQVSSMRFNGDSLAAMRYDRRGFLAQEELGRHLNRSYEYDNDGNLLRQQLTHGARLLIERRYRYDPVGNLLGRQDVRQGRNSSVGLDYDPLGRVLCWTDPAGRLERYHYDPHGTLLQDVDHTQGADGFREAAYKDRRYIYDAAGNLVRRITEAGETTLKWDQSNRLVAAKCSRDKHVRFEYDALGRRIQTIDRNDRQRFYWDEERLLGIQHHNSVKSEFAFRPNSFEPLFISSDNYTFFDNDRVGLPLTLFDRNGEITEDREFGAFGECTNRIGDKQVPIHFQGQYFDEQTGFSYTSNRYYDAVIGEFISIDPIGLLAGTNLYSYAPNVWRWIDPLGLTCRIQGIHADTVTKGVHINGSNGVELKALPGHSGTVVFKPVFSRDVGTPKLRDAIAEATDDLASDPSWRRKLHDTAQRATRYLAEGGHGAKSGETRFLAKAVEKIGI